MSDILVVLAVLVVNLGLVSYLLYMRLGSGGAPRKVMGWLIAELWLTFAVAAAIMLGISRLLGPGGRQGALGELEDVGSRFGALPTQLQVMVVAGVLLAVGLVAYLLKRINRLVEAYPPPPPPSE